MTAFELGVCSGGERFVSDEDLEKALAKVLETFDGVENLSAEQRDGIASFIRHHDVLAVLPAGYGKPLLSQLIPKLCVELQNMGYSYYPKKSNCDCYLPTKCPNRMPQEAIGASRDFVRLFIWRRRRPRWCFRWSMLKPLDSLRNIGPQQHASNTLGSVRSSSAAPMSFRWPSPLRQYSCAKSVSVFLVFAFLVDSSQRLAW